MTGPYFVIRKIRKCPLQKANKNPEQYLGELLKVNEHLHAEVIVFFLKYWTLK